MKRVIRTTTYLNDLNAIEAYIAAKGSAPAGAGLWLHIDEQVTSWPIPITLGAVAGWSRMQPNWLPMQTIW